MRPPKAKERLKRANTFLVPTTVEERTESSVRLMEAADIPRFGWTIDSDTGDITVQSEVEPVSVHVWHASTCNTQRRDFRLLNLDSPCQCGLAVPGEDLCLNTRVLYRAETLQETQPGSLTWLAHKRPPIDDRWMIFFVDVQYNTTQTGRGWPFGNQGVLEFTSLVSIVHKNGTDVFPYNTCHGEECRSKLV